MAVVFTCPHCGKIAKIKDKYAGRRGGCPYCKRSVQIPGPTPAPKKDPLPVAQREPPRKKPAPPPRPAPPTPPAHTPPSAATLPPGKFEFPCVQCGQLLRADSQYAGKPTRCGRCQAIVTIPHQPTPSPAPPAPQPPPTQPPPNPLGEPTGSDLDLLTAADLSADAPALAPLPKPAAKPESAAPRSRRKRHSADWTWIVPVITIFVASFFFWIATGYDTALAILLSSLSSGLGLSASVASLCVFAKFIIAGEGKPAATILIFTLCCNPIGILIAMSYGWPRADEWYINRLMSVLTATFLGSWILGGLAFAVGGYDAFQVLNNQNAPLAQNPDQFGDQFPHEVPDGFPRHGIPDHDPFPDGSAPHFNSGDGSPPPTTLPGDPTLTQNPFDTPSPSPNPSGRPPSITFGDVPRRNSRPATPNATSNSDPLALSYRDLLLSDDLDEWNALLNWSVPLNRPLVALRWGIAVEPVAPPQREGVQVTARLTDLDRQKLRELTDSVGSDIVDGLNELAEADAFGAQPERGDIFNEYVEYVGVGPRAALVAAADRAGVDLLAVCHLVQDDPAEPISLVVRLVDSLDGRIIQSSVPLTSSDLFAKDEFVERVGAYVSAEFRIAAAETIPPEHARDRLAQLASAGEFARPYVPLAEVRFYELRRLLTADDALPFYEKILGPDAAQRFTAGTDDDRAAIITPLTDR